MTGRVDQMLIGGEGVKGVSREVKGNKHKKRELKGIKPPPARNK